MTLEEHTVSAGELKLFIRILVGKNNRRRDGGVCERIILKWI